MENFNDNKYKKIGDVVEHFILEILKKKYPNARNDNREGVVFEDWDLFVPELNGGVEVKGDFVSLETGNVVIEVRNKYGRLSALSKTKAKYWVIVTGKRLIWIKPLDIYRFIVQQPNSWFLKGDMVGDGDNYSKTSYMFKHDDFVLFTRGLDDEDGWVDMIEEDEPLHVNNFNEVKENFLNN